MGKVDANKVVSVVIVSYNNQEVIYDCLKSLDNQLNLKIYVVDNFSKQPFLETLKKKFPKINLIHNDENLGFSKANNQALRLVDTPYVLVLNSDTTVPPETIPAMVDYLEKHTKVGMVGCRVELVDGSLDKACRRSFPTPWVAFTRYSYLGKLFPKSKLFGQYNMTYMPEDETYEVDSLVGAFMLIRKKAMDEVGLFDEDYFMYGEDIDWCYRFWQKGWKIVYHPVVKIMHYKGVSSGLQKHSNKMTRAGLAGRRRTLDAFYNAMKIFYSKHYDKQYPRLLTEFVMLGVGLKHKLAALSLSLGYYRSQFFG